MNPKTCHLFSRTDRVFLTLFLILFPILTASAINTKLDDMDWREEHTVSLSQKARDAISLEGMEWKHGESEHFIFHFTQRWMAERATAEAETYYEFIKKDLQITEDRWEVKAHIFLFETDESWKAFIEKSAVDRWSGGLCINNEIFFLCPSKGNLFTGNTLPHELTHLICNRFVKGRVPVWLSEGIAEQQSRKHYYTYTRPKGYSIILKPNVVSEKNYIPLKEIVEARGYPADAEKVPYFYAESVRLVQFLIEDHSRNFLEFMQAMADGLAFDSALSQVYGADYRNIEEFEESFKKVAISQVKLVEDPKK